MMACFSATGNIFVSGGQWRLKPGAAGERLQHEMEDMEFGEP
jgi:hypothetical protein